MAVPCSVGGSPGPTTALEGEGPELRTLGPGPGGLGAAVPRLTERFCASLSRSLCTFNSWIFQTMDTFCNSSPYSCITPGASGPLVTSTFPASPPSETSVSTHQLGNNSLQVGELVSSPPPMDPNPLSFPLQKPRASGAVAIRCITSTHPQTGHHQDIEPLVLSLPHPCSVTSASTWKPPSSDCSNPAPPHSELSSPHTKAHSHHPALDLAKGQSAHYPKI